MTVIYPLNVMYRVVLFKLFCTIMFHAVNVFPVSEEEIGSWLDLDIKAIFHLFHV